MSVERWKAAARKVLDRERAVKLAVLLGICGIALIYLSSLFGEGAGNEKKAPEQPEPERTQEDYTRQLEGELSRIVTAITGEEAPAVLVTLASSAQAVYGLDETAQQTGTSHVILRDADGGQSALTVTRLEPEIKGVVIVSRRGSDPMIREQLIQAVTTALHLSSARVYVTGGGS